MEVNTIDEALKRFELAIDGPVAIRDYVIYSSPAPRVFGRMIGWLTGNILGIGDGPIYIALMKGCTDKEMFYMGANCSHFTAHERTEWMLEFCEKHPVELWPAAWREEMENG